jgi:serine/threonine protein kinase
MLYVLLTSSYPFNPECDDSELEKAIKTCKYIPQPIGPSSHLVYHQLSFVSSYNRNLLDSVSDSARSLVFGLLETDHSRRLTVAQALQHPFISQLSESKAELNVTPRRGSVLEKLRRTVTVIRGYQVRACVCEIFPLKVDALSVSCAASGKADSARFGASCQPAASCSCKCVAPCFQCELLDFFRPTAKKDGASCGCTCS